MGPRRATAGCCFVLLLGSLPHGGRSKKAGAPPFCSGHGHTTSPSFVCNCTSGWTGPDCSLRVCPVGTSWLAPQIGGSGVAHVHPPFAVCSDMGHCDAELGLCEVRSSEMNGASGVPPVQTGFTVSSACARVPRGVRRRGVRSDGLSA